MFHVSEDGENGNYFIRSDLAPRGCNVPHSLFWLLHFFMSKGCLYSVPSPLWSMWDARGQAYKTPYLLREL